MTVVVVKYNFSAYYDIQTENYLHLSYTNVHDVIYRSTTDSTARLTSFKFQGLGMVKTKLAIRITVVFTNERAGDKTNK